MSYWVLESNMSRERVPAEKKKCSWKREYFYRDADGRLAQVTECEDGALWRSPAIYRLKPNPATAEEGKPHPPKFVEQPGVWLNVPADAAPCSQDDYDAALARCIQAEKKDPLAAMAYKARKAAVERGPVAARVELAVVASAPAVPAMRALTSNTADPLLDYTVLDFEYIPMGQVPIELAAIRVVNGEVVDSMCSFIALPPGRSVPFDVAKLTGIQTQHLHNAPSVKAVLQRFLQLAGGSLLVAHNVSADRNVLEKSRAALGKTEPLPNKWLCTLNLAKDRHPGFEAHRLDYLCRQFGIDARGHHSALADVHMADGVLRYLHAERPVEPHWITADGKKPKAAKPSRGKKPAAAGSPDLFAAA